MQEACSWLSRQYILCICISRIAILNGGIPRVAIAPGPVTPDHRSLVLTASKSNASGVKSPADPFHPFLILGMLGILDDFQQVAVAPRPAAILRRTGSLAIDTARVFDAGFRGQSLFDLVGVFSVRSDGFDDVDEGPAYLALLADLEANGAYDPLATDGWREYRLVLSLYSKGDLSHDSLELEVGRCPIGADDCSRNFLRD